MQLKSHPWKSKAPIKLHFGIYREVTMKVHRAEPHL